jgi:hypothetical protein
VHGFIDYADIHTFVEDAKPEEDEEGAEEKGDAEGDAADEATEINAEAATPNAGATDTHIFDCCF